uniref:Uncharacterized protein n=1 Tax=viral metagenome TaxID=1070528 RepID=A0A6C0IH41_9ZZZZ
MEDNRINVDIIVDDPDKGRDHMYSNDFYNFFPVTFDTSVSELKSKIYDFFKTKGKKVVDFEAGRDGKVFSQNLSAKLNEYKDIILKSDNRNFFKKNYFNVFVELGSLNGGKRKRRTIKKRRTNKKRKSYSRK